MSEMEKISYAIVGLMIIAFIFFLIAIGLEIMGVDISGMIWWFMTGEL